MKTQMVIDGEMQTLRINGRTLGMKAMDTLNRRLEAKPVLE